MLIKSIAGDFELIIDKIEVEDRSLVIVGKMGVWDARSYLTAREVIAILGKLMRVQVLGFLLTLPIHVMRGERRAP